MHHLLAVFPQSLVDGLSFADSYPFLDSWVMEALAEVGVQAEYKPLNDIVSAADGEGYGRKIAEQPRNDWLTGACCIM